MKNSQKNKNVKSAIITSVAALTFGITVILLFAYVFIPSLLNNTSESIKRSFATRLYDMTFEQRRSEDGTEDEETAEDQTEAEQVFTQPFEEPLILIPRDEFLAVLETNDEIIGRVSVPPDIGYLVTQTDDNEFYLHHGYKQENSREGAIFLDYRCDTKLEELKGHYILYGHHMKRGTMFAHLMSYKNEDFFRENDIIRFDTLYADYKWEVFSAYVTGTDFYFIETNFSGDEDWIKFLRTIQNKSMFHTDVVLEPDDVVLTLCTCTYEFDDARFVIHARLIK